VATTEPVRTELRDDGGTAATPSDGSTLRLAGLVTAGVGGVGLGAGTFFAVRAGSFQSKVEDACAVSCEWSEVAADDATGRKAATRGKIAFAIGGAALIGGTVMYLLGRRSSTESAPIAVVPTSGGVAVWASGSF